MEHVEYAKQVAHRFKILKELHGTRQINKYIKILAGEYRLGIEDVKIILEDEGVYEMDKKYGFVIGRFQPFHFGHQHIINEMLIDGVTPIILIGDDGGKNLDKNPLSVEQRTELIEQVFPNACIIITVRDREDWDEWFSDVTYELKKISELINISLYYHNKECDRYDYFSHRGKEYYNEFYTKIYEDEGFTLRPVEFVERSDIVIQADARNIRDDFEAFKHLMDGRNYWKLKDWGW